MRFKDKVSIVTGAAQGMGKAIACGLGREGSKVAVADVLVEAGRNTVEEIKAQGGKAIFVKADVTNSREVKAAVQTVLKEFGDIDILVNNAGWSKVLHFVETDEELWDKLIDLNYKGVLICCRAVLDTMIKRKSGKIVNIASIGGKVGNFREAVYSGAKAGVITASKSLAKELARYNINVNCVCPGAIDTPLMNEVWAGGTEEAKFDWVHRHIPLGRMGRPDEIASAVLYLASDEASYITGQAICVDGGFTCA